jgi:hypothetical protein
MSWYKVRGDRVKGDRRYVWELRTIGNDFESFTVIGTHSKVEKYCEDNRLFASARYKVSYADLDNPFAVKL